MTDPNPCQLAAYALAIANMRKALGLDRDSGPSEIAAAVEAEAACTARVCELLGLPTQTRSDEVPRYLRRRLDRLAGRVEHFERLALERHRELVELRKRGEHE